MRKLIIPGFLLILIYGCSTPSDNKTDDLFNQGVSEINLYNFEKAQSIFAEIEELDPSSPFILQARGLVYERQLNYYDALHEYLSAHVFNPEFVPAVRGLYRIYTHLGDYEDAALAATDYVRLLPEDPNAKLILAEALINIRQPERARRVIDEASKLDLPANLTDIIIARTYISKHQFDSATAVLERALSHQNKSVVFLNGVADYYESIGKTDSSIAYSRLAMQESSDNPETVLKHFHRCLKHNYFFDARQMIAKIGTDGGSEIVHIGMELLYNWKHGHFKQSRWAAANFRKLSNSSLTSVIYDIQTLKPGTDQLTVIQEVSTIIYIMERNNYLEEFQDYMHIVLTVRLKKYRIERENLDALELISGPRINSREVRLATADLLKETGQNDKFNDLIALLVKYHSTQTDWLSGIADIYNDRYLGDFEEAEKFYLEALKQDAWYLPAFENLVKMRATLNRLRDALETFDKYSHFETTNPEIALMKALLLVKDGQIESGFTLFENNIGHVSGNHKFFRQFISALKKTESIKAIRSVTDLLIEHGTDNPDALTIAAEILTDLEDFAKAMKLADSALELDPDFIPASVQKARALYHLGSKDEAMEIFKANRRTNRNNTLNNYYYSRTLATDRIDLDRASNIARETLFNTFSDLKIWMNLCYVYYQAGRFDLSRGEALKAVGTYSEDPEPYFWIGMALYKENKPDARVKLEQAIKLGLCGKQLKEARTTLSKI